MTDGETTLREAQEQVDETICRLGGYWPQMANLARLFEECGELARAVNQTYGPKRIKDAEAATELADELGDVLFTVLVLANSMDVDATAALNGSIAKVRDRTGHAE